MTELLYLKGQLSKAFEATVIGHDLEQNGVLLDRSAFYPGGGGQLPDQGALSQAWRSIASAGSSGAMRTLLTATCRPSAARSAAKLTGTDATRSCGRYGDAHPLRRHLARLSGERHGGHMDVLGGRMISNLSAWRQKSAEIEAKIQPRS